MRNTIIKCLILLIITLTIILIPFIVQWILLNETNFPFNIAVSFSREIWFGFIASYIGAIGTTILGIIAIWQNKKYKELSDKSSEESSIIQKELKDLSKKTMDAIETLKRIELLKYYPSIERIPDIWCGITKKDYIKQFKNKNYVIQSNIINPEDTNDLNFPISELFDKYNTYLFIIKNIGEKAIRNFNCNNLLINGKQPDFVVNYECDIESGKCATIAILNFPQFKKNETIELNMRFKFKNLVMDDYYIDTEIFITFQEEAPESYVTKFTFPEKSNKNVDN